MFRKLAVALIAAAVFTAPVLAQGTAPAATPKIVAAKPSLQHAKHKRLAHHVMHVKHHKIAKHHTHHKVAKLTYKATKGATYMRAGAATHPTAKIAHKPIKHTVKTTHRVKHVRLARKSTTHAHSDATGAHKSVN
jgi:hypothetical protein